MRTCIAKFICYSGFASGSGLRDWANAWSLSLPHAGTFFPELRIYHENQVVNVTCPRDCSPNGNRLAFCIFDNANPTQRDLNTYHLNNKLLVSDQGSDCGDRTSGNGSAFISFRVKRRMSGSTIYCAPTIENCSSLCNTLITPLMINVEGMYYVCGLVVGIYMDYLAW